MVASLPVARCPNGHPLSTLVRGGDVATVCPVCVSKSFTIQQAGPLTVNAYLAAADANEMPTMGKSDSRAVDTIHAVATEMYGSDDVGDLRTLVRYVANKTAVASRDVMAWTLRQFAERLGTLAIAVG